MKHRVDSTMAILFIYVPKSLPPSPSPPSSETKRIGNDKTSKSNKFSPPKLRTLAFDWRSPILQATSRSRRRRRLLESSIQVVLRCLCCFWLHSVCLSVYACVHRRLIQPARSRCRLRYPSLLRDILILSCGLRSVQVKLVRGFSASATTHRLRRRTPVHV